VASLLSRWSPATGHARYLGDDEVIVLEVRRHPAVLLRPFFETLGVIAVAALLGSATSPGRGDAAVDTVLGWIAVAFVMRFMWRCIEWSADHIVVSDKRMFEVSGILARKVASMPLSKLTDLTYRRSIAGRLLRYGDLTVETPGQRQALTHIAYLPRPDRFYRTLNSLVMARNAPEPVPVPVPEEAFEHDDEDTGPLPRVIL
jgi:Bacterial PH domain